LFITNLQITHPSPERPIILRIQNQEKLKEVRLRKYLQKQKSKLVEHSWRLIRRERLFLRRGGKTLGCFFKKSSVDRNKPIKGLWTNLEQFAKMF